jgi:hypothetical protein
MKKVTVMINRYIIYNELHIAIAPALVSRVYTEWWFHIHVESIYIVGENDLVENTWNHHSGWFLYMVFPCGRKYHTIDTSSRNTR